MSLQIKDTGILLLRGIMARKKITQVLHKWLSVPLGIIITLICLTGAALVFQQEILELSNPSHYFVDELKDEPIALDKLVAMVNAELEDNAVANVKISSDPKRTYTMTLAKGFRISVFVNQYTGEITGRYAVKEHGFFIIMSLHRWLLDDTRTWGKNIVGWSTVFFIVILITGYFYRTKQSTERYKIHFDKGTKRLMLGLHNALGTYAALVLIICALSGLMWSFDWFRNSVFAIFGAEKEVPKEKTSRPEKKEKAELNTIYWQVALENTMKAAPNYESIRIGDGMATVHPNTTYRTRVQDKYMFYPNSGEIKKTILFDQEDVKTKVWAWAYSLHVGDYWGIWSKIFTFIFCIIGASLPITGYYFFIKKWKDKRKKQKRRTLVSN